MEERWRREMKLFQIVSPSNARYRPQNAFCWGKHSLVCYNGRLGFGKITLFDMKKRTRYGSWPLRLAIFAFLMHVFAPTALRAQPAPWQDMCRSGADRTQSSDRGASEKHQHTLEHCQTCCSQWHSPGLPCLNIWQLGTLPNNRHDLPPRLVAPVVLRHFPIAQARAPPLLP
jgi:hypothetical protein